MNIRSIRFVMTLLVAGLAVAACSERRDDDASSSTSTALGPGGPGGSGGSGFRERDPRPVIELPTPNHTSMFRLVRGADAKRTPFFVQGSVVAQASFVPSQTRWVVSGGSAFVAAKGQVLGCFTTTSTFTLSSDPSTVSTLCAAFSPATGAFGPVLEAGTWLRGVGDDGTVIWSTSADPMQTETDGDGRGCRAARWDGVRFVDLGKSFCSLAYLEGRTCREPCSLGAGRVDANGSCVMPPDAPPACPQNKRCTGDPSNLCI